MTFFNKALIVVAALAIAACNNPRGGIGGDGDGWGGGAGITSAALGDPNDPNSIAHFNQIIGDRVLFTVDSSTITAQGQATLREQAAWINRNPQVMVLIEGHADERGTREYNIALGARRAAAVEQFLIQQGVSGTRLRTVSYGKERPVEACAEQRCWDLNRRSVTVISR